MELFKNGRFLMITLIFFHFGEIRQTFFSRRLDRWQKGVTGLRPGSLFLEASVVSFSASITMLETWRMAMEILKEMKVVSWFGNILEELKIDTISPIVVLPPQMVVNSQENPSQHV